MHGTGNEGKFAAYLLDPQEEYLSANHFFNSASMRRGFQTSSTQVPQLVVLSPHRKERK
jgi:hypothetical protein